MLAFYHAGSLRCASTLTRNVAAPAVDPFRSPLNASRKISASGAPTHVVFPPSPAYLFKSCQQRLVVVHIKHGVCHIGAT